MRSSAVGAMLVWAVLAASCGGAGESAPKDLGISTSLPVDAAEPGIATPVGFFSRVGDGRAVTAHRAWETNRLVIGTTVGLAVGEQSGEGYRMIERSGRSTPARIAVSPDGRSAVVVGDDPASPVEVWDLVAGELLLEQPTADTRAAVLGVEFEPDSQHFVIGTPSTVTRRNITGAETVLFEAPPGAELGPLVGTPGSETFVVPILGEEPAVAVWKPSDPVRVLGVPAPANSRMGRLSLSSDGQLAAAEFTGGVISDELLAVIDLATGEVGQFPTGPDGISPSPWVIGEDGRTAAAIESSLRIVDRSGNEVGRADLSGLPTIRSVLSPQGLGAFVTIHEDGSLRAWNDVGEQLGSSQGIGPVRDVSSSGAGRVVVVGFSGSVATVDLGQGEIESELRYSTGSVNDVAVSRAGTQVAASDGNGVVRVIDVRSGVIDSVLDHDGRNVDSVAWSLSDEVATGVSERVGPNAFDDTLTIWSPLTSTPALEFGGDGEDVQGCMRFRNIVRYSPDGTLLVSSSHDFTVTVRESADPEDEWVLPPHRSTILGVEFSPDGSRLVVTSDDSIVRVWDVATRALASEFVAPPGGYWAISVSRDGATFAAVDVTGGLSIVDAEDGRVVQTLEVPVDWESTVAISPDGQTIAAGGREHDVVLWHPAEDRFERLTGHSAAPRSVAFDPTGTVLFSGAEDGTVRAWKVPET